MMTDRVARYIASHHLLDKAARHLVALSGGADSVCLLHVLKSLGYNVEAVHCNFHLRGEESDRDENFCRELCEGYGVPFHIVHFDTKTYAELHKVSIEMAARELRYAYFEQLRQDIDAADICVAHHEDDNVETVIINLIRGTGVNGLMGIRPLNGKIVRPLLCVSRRQILDYLDGVGQSYVTDSTNLVDDVVRNKIRLNVIPLLKEINPAVTDNISRMTEWMTEVKKITDAAMDSELDAALSVDGDGIRHVSIAKLKKSVSMQYALFTLLHPYGFTTSQINEIAGSDFASGKYWKSTTHVVVVGRGELLLGETPVIDDAIHTLPECGNYVLGESRWRVSIANIDDDFVISKSSHTATLDADKVKFPLRIRRVCNGDRFVPFGMKGSKLVSDYLTDRKIDYFARQRQKVVVDADGKIIWLVGQRTDMRCAIDNKSARSLILSLS